ncbi:MAG: DUF6265 family protein [Acidobacteriota bacterium]|nr:DUF6265 family protein [Acidobacteriota bacterium]
MRNAMLAAAALLVAAFAGAQPASLDPVAFIAGTWSGEDGGVRMEEHWTAPSGGLMLGLHRDVAEGRAVFFEFLRIEATPKGIVYLASPKGAPATPFPLVESGENRAVFENRTHDFPTRIIYRLMPDGSLNARIEGTKKGKPAFEEWTWKKVR